MPMSSRGGGKEGSRGSLRDLQTTSVIDSLSATIPSMQEAQDLAFTHTTLATASCRSLARFASRGRVQCLGVQRCMRVGRRI